MRYARSTRRSYLELATCSLLNFATKLKPLYSDAPAPLNARWTTALAAVPIVDGLDSFGFPIFENLRLAIFKTLSSRMALR